MEQVNVTLISGRTSQQGSGLEVGKMSDRYFDSVTYVELSADDADALGIVDELLVEVATSWGSVVVLGRRVESLDSGIAFFPYGPWANQVFGSKTEGTGMPHFKGIKATVKLAEGKRILSLAELVEEMRRKA